MSSCYSVLIRDILVETGTNLMEPGISPILITGDRKTETGKYCYQIDIGTLESRLRNIGYTEQSVEDYLHKYKKTILAKQVEIYFRNSSLQFVQPDESFWKYFRNVDYQTLLSVIKIQIKHDRQLSNNEIMLMQLIDNADERYEFACDEYFDPLVKYFFFTMVFLESDIVVFDYTDLVIAGYYNENDFPIEDTYQILLQERHPNTLVRYNTIDLKENEVTEFKEIKGKSPIRSIKNTIHEYLVAFLNGQGGQIIWGVSDSRKIMGFPADYGKKDEIKRVVYDQWKRIVPYYPETELKIEFLDIIENGAVQKDFCCLCITVPEGNSREMYFLENGRTWIRLNGVNKELKGYNLYSFVRKRMENEQQRSGT